MAAVFEHVLCEFKSSSLRHQVVIAQVAAAAARRLKSGKNGLEQGVMKKWGKRGRPCF